MGWNLHRRDFQCSLHSSAYVQRKNKFPIILYFLHVSDTITSFARAIGACNRFSVAPVPIAREAIHSLIKSVINFVPN